MQAAMCEGCVEACTEALILRVGHHNVLQTEGENIRVRIKARSNEITVDEEHQHCCYRPREDDTDFISWQERSRRPPAVLLDRCSCSFLKWNFRYRWTCSASLPT